MPNVMRPAIAHDKVLVADDEMLTTVTLRVILEQAGYKVAAVHNGKDAVDLASSFRPDILLTDVQMPKLNGIDAALAIVSKLPNCKVLLYTAAPVLPADSLARAKALGHNFPVVEKPVAPEELLDKVRRIAKERRETSYRAVVLNVDDSDIQRYAVTRMLTFYGFVVREARTGNEALAEAKKHPDLVLLDINLPDISGFEVCQRLKESPDTADIPVVHLTNTYRDEVAKAKALSYGAADFFTHPVQPDTLLAKIRELVQGPDEFGTEPEPRKRPQQKARGTSTRE